MPTFCSYCGTKLTGKYCSNCGHRMYNEREEERRLMRKARKEFSSLPPTVPVNDKRDVIWRIIADYAFDVAETIVQHSVPDCGHFPGETELVLAEARLLRPALDAMAAVRPEHILAAYNKQKEGRK